MGWTTCHKDWATIRDMFESHWISADPSKVTYNVLETAQVGFNRAYAAIEKTNVETNKKEVFAATYLIQFTKGYYNFGYKDMTEYSGPYNMNDCPLKILKLLTPIKKNERDNRDNSTQWARNWRARCWKYQRTRKKNKSLSVGTIIQLNYPLHFSDGTEQDEFEVYLTKPLRFKSVNGYGVYRIKRSTLTAVGYTIIKKPKSKKKNYPIYIDPYGCEHKCIGWACDSFRSGWEWYSFRKISEDVHEGFVHGDADEFGSFSIKELTNLGIKFETNPDELQQLMPPIGWKKIA